MGRSGNSKLHSSFEERGYIGPVPLFTTQDCRQILASLREDRRPPADWGKGWAATSAAYYALATNDRILDLVTPLLGEDILLWGASQVTRVPGAEHRWHTDAESSSPTSETVSVWIGLTGTSVQTSLKVVPFSHRFGVTLQEMRQANGGDLGGDDDDVSCWAKERDGRSGVLTLDAGDGDAIVFDGRLWHGSHNVSRDTRRAILLQYATPGTEIRIPNLERLTWPFEFFEVPKPPCIVVSGRDPERRNRLVPGPTAGNVRVMIALSSRVHRVQLPLDQDPDVGWKPHPLFRGSTADLREMRCHVSVLDPGREPHPPHRHDAEELLLVLDGEPELVTEDPGTPEGTSTRSARRGDFAFYPAGFAHTIRNTFQAPATYVMFKWTSDRNHGGELLDHRVLSPDEPSAASEQDGVSMTALLNGQTSYLRRLHSHVTTLRPGAGYEPHVDAYDVAIVVLEGLVETLGDRVGPNGVIFYAAGEPHGMRNVGDSPARYLVFEFRGRHSRIEAPETFGRRVWNVARDPRRLKRGLAYEARRLLRLPRRQG